MIDRGTYFTCQVCKHKFIVRGTERKLEVALHFGAITHGVVGRVCPLPPYRDSKGYWKS